MLLRIAVALTLLASPALADDCKPIVDALTKLATTLHHQVITGPVAGEVITTADARYIQVRGKWTKRPYNGARAAQSVAQDLATKRLTCKPGAGGTVNSEPALRIDMHVRTDDGDVSDSQFWISTATGLPLKEVIKLPGAERVVIFDYAGIKAPM